MNNKKLTLGEFRDILNDICKNSTSDYMPMVINNKEISSDGIDYFISNNGIVNITIK